MHSTVVFSWQQYLPWVSCFFRERNIQNLQLAKLVVLYQPVGYLLPRPTYQNKRVLQSGDARKVLYKPSTRGNENINHLHVYIFHNFSISFYRLIKVQATYRMSHGNLQEAFLQKFPGKRYSGHRTDRKSPTNSIPVDGIWLVCLDKGLGWILNTMKFLELHFFYKWKCSSISSLDGGKSTLQSFAVHNCGETITSNQ